MTGGPRVVGGACVLGGVVGGVTGRVVGEAGFFGAVVVAAGALGVVGAAVAGGATGRRFSGTGTATDASAESRRLCSLAANSAAT